MVWPHFASPETMKLSMITCAALREVAELRLPEDQAVRRVPPSSRTRSPRQADLRERAVVQLERRRAPRAGSGSARSAGPVFSSWRTRWRWEKVPRSVSCPVRRMWIPVGEQRGEGERLGVAELDPALVQRLEAPASSGLRSLRWIVKLSGTSSSSSFELAQPLLGDGGLDARAAAAVELAGAGRGRGRRNSPDSILRAARRCAALQLASALVVSLLDLVRGDDPLLDQLLGVELG